MDTTSQSAFLMNGVYSLNYNCPAVKKEFSEKAKAFTIDALLSTDKEESKPVIQKTLPFQTKTEDSTTPWTLFGGKQSRNEINMNTPDKEQNRFSSSNDIVSSSQDIITYEEFSKELTRKNDRCASNQRSYLPWMKTVDSPQHLNFNSPSAVDVQYYSPLMTGGFFRPVECYSPMSYEGQSTPAGLKTFYQTPSQTETPQYGMNYASGTPNIRTNSSSLSNGYSTPTEKHGIPLSGGRKILSSRKHERPHPYLSSKHKIILDTPDKSDIQKLLAQELPKQESKGTVKGKRHRTAFTQEQLQCLEAEFGKQQYLVGEERCQLAESLNLTVSQVKVWFQNRRIKWRKEQFGENKIDVQC